MHRLIDATTGDVVVPRLELARAFRPAAMRGLLGRSALAADAGLLLSDPLRCVHTVGMRFAIDVVFLDARLRVVGVVEAVGPARLVWHRRGRHQLELAAGAARSLGLRPERTLRVASAAQGGQRGGGSPHTGPAYGDAAHEAALAPCAADPALPSIPPAVAAAVGEPPLPKGAE